MGKRYINNVYPIAGLRWVDKDGINDDDALLFTLQRIKTASDRSQIANDQHLIKWVALKQAIEEQVVFEAIKLENIPNVASVDTKYPIYRNSNNKGLFTFDEIGQGTGIVLTQEPGYVKISLKTYEDTGYPLPVLYEFQRNALTDMVEGGLIYNRDSKQLNWWTGVVWKSTNV